MGGAMNRRSFLRLLGIGATAAVAPLPALPLPPPSVAAGLPLIPGGAPLTFGGIPIIMDPRCPPGRIYLISPRYMSLEPQGVES